MKNNQNLLLAWCIMFIIAAFLLFGLISCDAETAESQPLEIDKPIYDIPLEETEYTPIFQRAEFMDYGYENMAAWFNDMKIKNAEAVGIADAAIDTYSEVITDEEIAQLREYEDVMSSTLSIADYNAASESYNTLIATCQANLDALYAPVYTYSGGSGWSGSGTPYDFYTMGVLYDDTYRYTYYSSNVLYHYKTPEWTLGSDGIYRDSNGYVVVASDDYAEGTVVESDLFGTCIVLDCGVGSSGTLDVYVGW